MRWVVAGSSGACVLACLTACGRIGYDPLGERLENVQPDARMMVDASPAASSDGGPDGCPEGTTEITSGAVVCIEQAQRGLETWLGARADCMALGRRLCADAEWFTACMDAIGLSDMLDDYEWVAEESGGIAQKRGPTACSDMSAHEIMIDRYGYRCCVDRPGATN